MRSALNASCIATLLCGAIAFAVPVLVTPAFAQPAAVGTGATVPVPAVTPPTGAVNAQAANAQGNANAAIGTTTTGRMGTMGNRATTGVNGTVGANAGAGGVSAGAHVNGAHVNTATHARGSASANAAEQETTRQLNQTQGVTTSTSAGAGASITGQ